LPASFSIAIGPGYTVGITATELDLTLKLAIIGDIHGAWVDADIEYFNRGHYDAVIFVGDLPPLIGSLPTARRLSALRVPAFLIPGNHDATSAAQFLAELRHKTRLADLLSFGHGRRETALRRALGPVKLIGYSLDLMQWNGKPLGLLAARPYSMGGDRLYFRAYLQRRHGVASFEDSTAKLRALVDQAPQDIIFISHNGPAGLGAARDDIWGRDFHPEGGDFGDPDLRAAIDYAVARGKTVHAVMAGHMHQRMKRGGMRRNWQVSRDGILYINAARVLRIKRSGDNELRHHVALTLEGSDVRAEAVWIDANGEVARAPE
jgi:uncharacterized protein (TIGR04168 family)